MLVALVAVRPYGIPLTTMSRFWKPTVAAGVMAALLILISTTSMWLAVAIGAGVYLATLALLGGISLQPGALPALKV